MGFLALESQRTVAQSPFPAPGTQTLGCYNPTPTSRAFLKTWKDWRQDCSEHQETDLAVCPGESPLFFLWDSVSPSVQQAA